VDKQFGTHRDNQAQTDVRVPRLVGNLNQRRDASGIEHRDGVLRVRGRRERHKDHPRIVAELCERGIAQNQGALASQRPSHGDDDNPSSHRANADSMLVGLGRPDRVAHVPWWITVSFVRLSRITAHETLIADPTGARYPRNASPVPLNLAIDRRQTPDTALTSTPRPGSRQQSDPRLGLAEIQPDELTDPFQPVAQRAPMDTPNVDAAASRFPPCSKNSASVAVSKVARRAS
jgi:hypothetical protein